MLNFEINPTSLISVESFIVVIFALLIFVAIPLILAIVEYRITKNNMKYGLYLLYGVFSSVILFGIFSLFIGILLTCVYFITSYFMARTNI